MTTKVFVEKGRVKLVGDPRGFTISSKQRKMYWDWCQTNHIETEYHGTLSGSDLWYVKNEKDRMLAILKWS
jgi:hypothetical protein